VLKKAHLLRLRSIASRQRIREHASGFSKTCQDLGTSDVSRSANEPDTIKAATKRSTELAKIKEVKREMCL